MSEFRRIGSRVVENGTLELMIELGTLPSDDFERYQELNSKVSENLMEYFTAALDDLSKTSRLLKATEKLMSRHYWGRVWVLQEFAVSPELCIQCGTIVLPFEQFYGGLFYIQLMKLNVLTRLGKQLQEVALRLGPESVDADHLQIFYSMAHLETPSLSSKLFGIRRRFNDPAAKKDNLMQVLARVHVVLSGESVKSTIGEDRVFGLLGLAFDERRLSIVVDYTKSCSDIYTETARAIIFSEHVDLLSLSQRHKRNPILPSWVPDWQGTIVRPSGQMPWDTSFCASGNEVFRPTTDRDKFPCSQIALYGYEVDTIEIVGAPWTPVDQGHIVTDTPSDPAPVRRYLAEIDSFCHQSDTKFQESGVDIYANVDDRTHARSRIPVADQEQYGMGFIRKAGQPCLLGHEQVLRHLATPQLEQTAEMGGYRNAMSWQQFRRPILSVKGYVGLAPDHAEVGDVVVIFSGAKFPYVLRKNGDGLFTFIGEAYVHGIMYGELVERKETGLKIFVLY